MYYNNWLVELGLFLSLEHNLLQNKQLHLFPQISQPSMFFYYISFLQEYSKKPKIEGAPVPPTVITTVASNPNQPKPVGK